MKLVIAAVLAALATSAGASTYDPHAAFSGGSNPNGVYTYGYETSLGGPLALLSTTSGTAWTAPVASQYLGVYDTATKLLQHPGSSGQYSIVRITLPSAVNYTVIGSFANGDNATTDVHVLTNGIAAFNGALTGAGSSSAFSFARSFTAGSTIDFAVDYGSNGNYYNDSTLLGVTVAGVPEPAIWSPLIGGFAMTGFAARRRRIALTA